MSKAEETIKTEKGRDGLNREWAWIAKVSQYHEVAFAGQLYMDFFAAALFHTYGITDSATGTTKSGGGNTTLSSSVSAGSTTIPLTATTNFSSGDTVQVGSGTGGDTAELVVIGTPASNCPITTPSTGLRFAHSSGLVVKSVVDPFTHTGTSTNAIPATMSFEHSIGQAPSPTSPLDVVRTADGIFTNVKVDAVGGKVATTNYSLLGRLGVPGQTAASVAFTTDRPATLADATFTIGAYGSTPGTGMDAVTADITHFMLEGKLTPDPVQTAGNLAPYQNAAVRETSVELDVYVPSNALMREIWYGSASGTTPITAVQEATLQVLFDLGGTPDHNITLLLNNFAGEVGSPTFASDGKAMIFKIKGSGLVSGNTGALTVTTNNSFGLNYGFAGA
jgi:hypothetical protein